MQEIRWTCSVHVQTKTPQQLQYDILDDNGSTRWLVDKDELLGGPFKLVRRTMEHRSCQESSRDAQNTYKGTLPRRIPRASCRKINANSAPDRTMQSRATSEENCGRFFIHVTTAYRRVFLGADSAYPYVGGCRCTCP